MFKKLNELIIKSVKRGNSDVSHTRLSSYIILFSIIVSTFIFIGIDVVNGIIEWSRGNLYEVPAAHITIFGMILGHHLFLLGIKKSSENKQKKYDSENELSKTDENEIKDSDDIVYPDNKKHKSK